MSKSWYSEVVPEERWVWLLSGAEGPNSWDLGMQIASKNGFVFYLLTQTQVRCFNYQHGWKISLPDAPQGYQFSIFWVLQLWTVKGQGQKHQEVASICTFLHPLQNLLSGIGSTSSTSCQARRPAGGAKGWKKTSDVAGDKQAATETLPPSLLDGERRIVGTWQTPCFPIKEWRCGAMWCLALSTRA